LQLRVGADFDPLTINAKHQMLDLIWHGTLRTDGSEQDMAFTQDQQTGVVITHPRSPITNLEHVHDDFAAYQDRQSAQKLTGKYMLMKKDED
jgi:hypothetical protein